MMARIGTQDESLFESPQPKLLSETSGISPLGGANHVLFGDDVRSTQRLAVGEHGGTVRIGLWPAELKEQALYLYGRRLARPMIKAARQEGWSASANPHLAFRSSQPALRLYMAPALDASEYAGRWEMNDLDWVGAYSRTNLRGSLWPWLKSRGYVTNDDDEVLEKWLTSCLGKRDAFMRAGLRLVRECGPGTTADVLRREINAILKAAQEPALPSGGP